MLEVQREITPLFRRLHLLVEGGEVTDLGQYMRPEVLEVLAVGAGVVVQVSEVQQVRPGKEMQEVAVCCTTQAVGVVWEVLRDLMERAVLV